MPNLQAPLSEFLAEFRRLNGSPLPLADLGCKSVRELIDKVPGLIKVNLLQVRHGNAMQQTFRFQLEPSPEGSLVSFADNRKRSIQAQQIYYLFLKRPDAEMTTEQFRRAFQSAFNCSANPDALKASFPDILEVCSCSRPLLF